MNELLIIGRPSQMIVDLEYCKNHPMFDNVLPFTVKMQSSRMPRPYGRIGVVLLERITFPTDQFWPHLVDRLLPFSQLHASHFVIVSHRPTRKLVDFITCHVVSVQKLKTVLTFGKQIVWHRCCWLLSAIFEWFQTAPTQIFNSAAIISQVM